jgi:4,5-DOPA dioxygenase extradiol
MPLVKFSATEGGASAERLPVLFVSHGAPDIALQESSFSRALESFGRQLDPRAIVAVSAHWEAPPPVRVTSSERPGIVHDFGGFPEALYRLDYPAPGDPGLAREICRRLELAGVPSAPDPGRPFDHGAWVPLRFLRPAADVPVVQMSLPVPRSPEQVLAMGAALSDLRERGVLLLATGGIVHNLRRLRFDRPEAPPDDWVLRFEEWLLERLQDGQTDRILRYREEAPGASLAAPSTEHFDPLFFALGARQAGDRFVLVHSGIEYGNLSLAAFAFGPPPAPDRRFHPDPLEPDGGQLS